MSAALKHAYRTIIKLTAEDAERYRHHRGGPYDLDPDLIDAEQAHREAAKGLALLEAQEKNA